MPTKDQVSVFAKYKITPVISKVLDTAADLTTGDARSVTKHNS